MFNKVILFITVVGFSNAVIIDTSVNHDKNLVKSQGWQMVKIYDPPSHTVGYKYEPYAYPKYEFEYSVSDKKSGDHKHHHEARDGDRVRGEYSLVETDGSLRKVQYHADDHNGFNAIVSKHVNKHNDHAVSITDQTRFFYPVGQNVKIDHYFPSKDYHYRSAEKSNNNVINKPVYEETTPINNNDGKTLEIESQGKDVEISSVSEQQTKIPLTQKVEPSPKAEIIDTVPVQIVPAAISMGPKNDSAENIALMPNAETTQKLPTNELTSPNEKGDQNDSEVASSYYHSKFYYIGY